MMEKLGVCFKPKTLLYNTQHTSTREIQEWSCGVWSLHDHSIQREFLLEADLFEYLSEKIASSRYDLVQEISLSSVRSITKICLAEMIAELSRLRISLSLEKLEETHKKRRIIYQANE